MTTRVEGGNRLKEMKKAKDQTRAFSDHSVTTGWLTNVS